MVRRAWQIELDNEAKQKAAKEQPLPPTRDEIEREFWAINDATLDEMDEETL